MPAKSPVKVDGKFDEWDLSGQIWSYADNSVRDSFSVKTAAMWDADNLYLDFVWRDPMPLNSTVDPKFDTDRGWVADAVQLRVLAGKQPSWFTAWGFDKGTRPVVHTYSWPEENKSADGKTVLRSTDKAGEATLGEAVESASALLPDGKGFVHELKLPWKVVYNEDWKGAAGQDHSRRYGVPLGQRGANVLVATDTHVFTVPNGWGVSGAQPLRMNAKDGNFSPFVGDGKELPMPPWPRRQSRIPSPLSRKTQPGRSIGSRSSRCELQTKGSP